MSPASSRPDREEGRPAPERSRLAPEGLPFVAAAAFLAAAGIVAAAVWDRWPVWAGAGLLTALALLTVFFFRDPARTGPRGDDLVVAAADGLVLGTEPVDHPPYLGGPGLRVSVFLSLLDVHVNRYPVSGRVEWREERGGGFEPAWRASAALHNASVTLGIRREDGRRVAVRQVVGLVARRIVSRAREGDAVEQGARMGVMRFGSRLDLFLPPDAEVRVRKGDRAVGGVTVMARLGPPAGRGAGAADA
ncbi:MAG TPA: phosphatidylserine decarboxylase [Gemmatimonadota bacterium]|nr:phosphatidylserine decarboxylase [Gemmatimonadota bacterium]